MNNTSSLFAILPILIVMVTGMAVLLADSCLAFWRRARVLSALLSLIGIGIAAFYCFPLMAEGDRTAFNGAIVADSFAQACNLILLVTAALAVLLAMTYLENRRLNLGEYYALVLFSTSGAMLMAAANDLIVLFIALEILSVALYVLAGFARTEERSEEAALKYFLLGAFAAGFLLYGIALVYGGSADVNQGGTTNLSALAAFLQANHTAAGPSLMLMVGIALLLVGLAFKVALVPFHMWTPDVYEGAPTSVTAYMAAGAKIGAVAAILRVFNALTPISEYWLIAIQVLAVLTMFAGNILAVTQDNVKRMLAYSSIAHAGYLMVAVSAATSATAHGLAFSAAVFYLLAYTLMTMGAFGVLIWLSRRGRDLQTLSDLKGLARTDPAAAYTMLVFMLSLGGIPPTMGFMGKWLIFYATLQAGQTWLAIALALASVISIYYYLKVVWMMCFQEPEGTAAPQRALAPGGVVVSVAVTVAASLLFGIVPNLVRGLMEAAATVVHP
jgi:NADH-quinone oxidoreductase subunit N